MKAVVAAFNQEKTLVGAFPMIFANKGSFEALTDKLSELLHISFLEDRMSPPSLCCFATPSSAGNTLLLTLIPLSVSTLSVTADSSISS